MTSQRTMTRELDPIDPAAYPPPQGDRTPDAADARPWNELRSSGLLWLINATVFHPRGYAIGLHRDAVTGEYLGWTLLGDGAEPWVFSDDGLPDGEPTLDDLFRLAKAMLP